MRRVVYETSVLEEPLFVSVIHWIKSVAIRPTWEIGNISFTVKTREKGRLVLATKENDVVEVVFDGANRKITFTFDGRESFCESMIRHVISEKDDMLILTFGSIVTRLYVKKIEDIMYS